MTWDDGSREDESVSRKAHAKNVRQRQQEVSPLRIPSDRCL